MSMVPDAREAKLAKWAQAVIADLRRDLTQVREDFEEYADKVTEDETVGVANPYDAHPRPVLRQGETLRLLLDGVDGFRWVDVKTRDREVEIRASSGLLIVPQVTNVLTLTLTRD